METNGGAHAGLALWPGVEAALSRSLRLHCGPDHIFDCSVPVALIPALVYEVIVEYI